VEPHSGALNKKAGRDFSRPAQSPIAIANQKIGNRQSTFGN